MQKEIILEEIVKGYRDTIYLRYQYHHIKENYTISDSITKETVDELRSYFLDYMYPEMHKRTQLNKAFESLDHYTKNPKKLLRILLDTTQLIFTHGRHLPKLLQTGLEAMKSFRVATNFENQLVDQAILNKIKPPYDNVKITMLIKQLSRKEVENFIEVTQSLFDVLHNKKLIKKIKEIILYLIGKMKEKESIYSKSQIQGFEIGYKMLHEGDKIFNKLSKQDQQNLINTIVQIERDNLNYIF